MVVAEEVEADVEDSSSVESVNSSVVVMVVVSVSGNISSIRSSIHWRNA